MRWVIQSVGFVGFSGSVGNGRGARCFISIQQRIGNQEEELRFLQEFAQQVGSPQSTTYVDLMTAAARNARVSWVERARFARGGDDGRDPSADVREMQSTCSAAAVGAAAGGHERTFEYIQKLLREEVLNCCAS